MSSRPIESFGNELLVALIRGSRSELLIPIPEYRKAIALRQRINQLRNSMKASGHKLYPLAAKARVSILCGEKAGYPACEMTKSGFPRDRGVPAKLYLRPQDSEFRPLLEAAGIKADEFEDNLLDSIALISEAELVDESKRSNELLEEILRKS